MRLVLRTSLRFIDILQFPIRLLLSHFLAVDPILVRQLQPLDHRVKNLRFLQNLELRRHKLGVIAARSALPKNFDLARNCPASPPSWRWKDIPEAGI